MRRSSLPTFVCLLALAHAAAAQETTPAERLDELEQEIQEGEARLGEQEAEYQRIADELAGMRRRSVEIVTEVQALEQRMLTIESRLGTLHNEERATLTDLDRRRIALTDILAALQILERNKPPALLVRPDDAVDAARSAMLLGAILPEIEVQMTGLRTQLDALADVRQAIETDRAALADAGVLLAAEEESLDALMAHREMLTAQLAERVATERDRLAGVSAEASSIRELVDQLTRRFSAAAPSLRPSPNAPPLITQFSETLGSLRMPAAGRLLAEFGETLTAGTHSQGIAVATRPGARITAPYDSEIVFAAPYRGYGQLLILSPGDGYLILLSGLARIDGVVGQQLLAGEPVGIMGSETMAPNVRRWAVSSETVEEGRPVLYLEMREDGEPVDPLPWFREDQWRADGS